MSNPGNIYEVKDGDGYAISYHKEQRREFGAIGKVYVHLFENSICTKPKLDDAGNPKKVLKSISKLKLIGYSD